MHSHALPPELYGAAQAFVNYLCVKTNENVLITADTRSDAGVVQSIVAVLIAIGARPCVLSIPQLPFQGKLADPYLPAPLSGAAAACDVWIDLTYPYLAGSTLHAQIMEQDKARYMLASDLNAEALLRLFGGNVLVGVLDDMEAFNALTTQAEAGRVRITSPLGTDVSYLLNKPKSSVVRQANAPGTYMIPGACGLYPQMETVVGKIVLETVFHEYYTPLSSQLTLEVDGRIQSVYGSGNDRHVLERALLRAGGGQFGYVIHFTHGVHPIARFTGDCFVEDIRAPGCNAIGLGLPWWVPGGGENHPDGVISAQSVWLDDKLIVDAGRTISKQCP